MTGDEELSVLGFSETWYAKSVKDDAEHALTKPWCMRFHARMVDKARSVMRDDMVTLNGQPHCAWWMEGQGMLLAYAFPNVIWSVSGDRSPAKNLQAILREADEFLAMPEEDRRYEYRLRKYKASGALLAHIGLKED